jgi:hypothetical protein
VAERSTEIPAPEPDDSDDVAMALETAKTLWGIGDKQEAIKWLRRAAEAAEQAENDLRAVRLARTAADLASALEDPAPAPVAMPSRPPPSMPPPPPSPSRTPPPPPSPTATPPHASTAPPETAFALQPKSRPPPPSAVAKAPAAAKGRRPPAPSAKSRAAPPPPRREEPSEHPPPAEQTFSVATRPKPELRAEPKPAETKAPEPKAAEPKAASKPLEPWAPPETRAPEPTPAAPAAPKPAARRAPAAVSGEGGDVWHALRVSVKPSVREPGLFIVRRLENGKAPPAESREALIVVMESGEEFFREAFGGGREES